MALNFAEAAGKKVAEIEKPPLPPVGTYRWSVTKLPTIEKSKDEQWEFVTYACRALEALDDVDMDGYKGEVSSITNSVKFIFNTLDEAEFEKTEYQHKRFLEGHLKCEGATIREMMNNSTNQQFTGNIIWKQDKNDHEIFHANIGRTAPLD